MARFIPNQAGIRKLKADQEKALNLTADIIAQRIDPQVPFRTGFLSQSALNGGRRIPTSKDTDAIKFIQYKAPYALKMYYGVGYNFSKNSHPQAQAFWGRELMTNKSEIEKIFKAAYKQIGGK